jgi:hypothetical protein
MRRRIKAACAKLKISQGFQRRHNSSGQTANLTN